jgi:hypothetical protein
VRDYETLASPGYAEYPSAAGHFVNELLPRLLHLDAHRPASVPLLWPPGALPCSPAYSTIRTRYKVWSRT